MSNTTTEYLTENGFEMDLSEGGAMLDAEGRRYHLFYREGPEGLEEVEVYEDGSWLFYRPEMDPDPEATGADLEVLKRFL